MLYPFPLSLVAVQSSHCPMSRYVFSGKTLLHCFTEAVTEAVYVRTCSCALGLLHAMVAGAGTV